MKASRLLALSSTLFLLGASTLFAESRIRLNTAISTSSEDPSLGTKSIGSGTAQATDVKDDQSVGGISVQYVTEGGWLWGVHKHTNDFTTLATVTSVTAAWTAATGGTAPVGTLLGTRKSSGVLNFLDLGYLFDFDGPSLALGLGLPVLGSSSETTVTYTTVGGSLSGVSTESIEAKGKSASSYFIDLGYAFGALELSLGYRSITTKSEADLNTSAGLGKLLASDKLESEGKHTLTTVGLGFLF